ERRARPWGDIRVGLAGHASASRRRRRRRRHRARAPPMSSRYPPPIGDNRLRRILVIDDNAAIHQDFRKILCPEPAAPALDALEEAVLGARSSSLPPASPFVVDAVLQGQDGFEAVRRMSKLGRPYALTFVDMRMPPGWDGIETLEQIWAVCPDIEAV